MLDEVQTGMYQTGPFLASYHFGIDPDMVVLAKALSEGLIPSGALLIIDVRCDLRFCVQLDPASDRPHIYIQRKRSGHAGRTGDAIGARAGSAR